MPGCRMSQPTAFCSLQSFVSTTTTLLSASLVGSEHFYELDAAITSKVRYILYPLSHILPWWKYAKINPNPTVETKLHWRPSDIVYQYITCFLFTSGCNIWLTIHIGWCVVRLEKRCLVRACHVLCTTGQESNSVDSSKNSLFVVFNNVIVL